MGQGSDGGQRMDQGASAEVAGPHAPGRSSRACRKRRVALGLCFKCERDSHCHRYGDQSFPFYPYFNSDRLEHRETLHACGVQAQRLLKKLLDGQYHNVRPEYAERLANYLDDLPTTAEGGSILLAYGDILNLRFGFEADFEVLPTPFATELRRVIENQFALNSFYDIVERHNEAIASGTRSPPFPKEAIRPLREFISREHATLFQSSMSPKHSESLDRAAPEEPRRSADDLKAAESSNMVQLPTPPGTPDVKQAHQRQTRPQTPMRSGKLSSRARQRSRAGRISPINWADLV